MKKTIIRLVAVVMLASGVVSYFYFKPAPAKPLSYYLGKDVEEEGEEDKEQRAFFVKQRILHEINMLKDPVTGLIPANIRQEELKLARAIPEKQRLGDVLGPENLNSYIPAGPNNIGGRTRAVAYDKRFNGTSNRVIIAGSVSGGIFRSADAGATWTRVSPDDDIHNLSSLAQDPRPGQEDVWYAGGGEPIANSASGFLAPFLGFGVWKSTNNGQTWTKLTRQITDIDGTTVLPGGTLEGFDNPLDMVHKIVVNPSNGHVYVAAHRRLIRSTDGGNSWRVVFTSTTATTADLGQMDIVCTDAGRLYLGVNGAMPDQDKRGVWTSNDGTNWTRLAGGLVLNTDSVAEWKGNSYDGNSKRIVMALAPSNQNILYVTYENGETHSSPSLKNEVDLFKYDAGSNTWTNLSANVPDFPDEMEGVDPFHIQGGYDLMVAVKPDDPNTVFLGGVNLFRSTSGFTNTTATTWIGGYGKGFKIRLSIYGSNNGQNSDISKWSHPDMHALVFDPSNPNKAICANDGGIQITDNIMATSGEEPVVWRVINNYQTLQYYHVAMDPGSGRNNFVGGAQDNGTRFRDAVGFLAAPANNDHYRIISGDGAAVGIAKLNGNSQFVYGATQFGNLLRITLSPGNISQAVSIRPSSLTPTPGLSNAFGEFVTYFKLDFDNTEDLYYVNFNRLFRTTAASTVSSSTWTELTGVRSAVNPGNPASGTNIGITAIELTRGDYHSGHTMYIGTSNGKVFRLDNPRAADPTTAPVDITPITMNGYITDIAANPNDDNEVMVVISNYNTTNIFYTKNARSASPIWYNAEGNLNLPSIRSCIIAVKKDGSNNPVTEYYVGTSVGLYSAVNIGNITPIGVSINVPWVREGGSVLNFAVISSLDYRPQDNTLLVGTHGNGMYYANLGTPDFRPSQPTGLPDPVRNDKNFIQKAFPTIARDRVSYQTGNMFTVKRLIVQVHSINGQQVIRNVRGYTNGEIDITKLSKGAYVLTITSDDYKQQFVQKFVKE
jgi:photosystem II stability/assembly factor-like uncharacterized protein